MNEARTPSPTSCLELPSGSAVRQGGQRFRDIYAIGSNGRVSRIAIANEITHGMEIIVSSP
jgi:hypothetical protein